MAFQFEPSVVVETIPMLMRGLKLTMQITVGGIILGFLLGSAAGLMKISRNFFIRKLAGVYIESIRGTPMLVQAMFLYYGVPMAVGIRIPPITAGIIIIAVNSGAYIAEIVRGGCTIDKSGTDGGWSLYRADTLADNDLCYLAPGVKTDDSATGQSVYYQPQGYVAADGDWSGRTDAHWTGDNRRQFSRL